MPIIKGHVMQPRIKSDFVSKTSINFSLQNNP